MTVLGLVGHQGSGKDTVADLLVQSGGWVKLAFGDPVREALYAMNPVIIDEALPGGFADYRELVDDIGYETAKRTYPEVRRMLQSFATDAVRDVIGQNTWIDLWKAKAREALAEGMRVVVPDVRFRNEVETIRFVGLSQSKIARVIRPGANGDDPHKGEQEAAMIPGDFPIRNDGDLENLKAALARPGLVGVGQQNS